MENSRKHHAFDGQAPESYNATRQQQLQQPQQQQQQQQKNGRRGSIGSRIISNAKRVMGPISPKNLLGNNSKPQFKPPMDYSSMMAPPDVTGTTTEQGNVISQSISRQVPVTRKMVSRSRAKTNQNTNTNMEPFGSENQNPNLLKKKILKRRVPKGMSPNSEKKVSTALPVPTRTQAKLAENTKDVRIAKAIPTTTNSPFQQEERRALRRTMSQRSKLAVSSHDEQIILAASQQEHHQQQQNKQQQFQNVGIHQASSNTLKNELNEMAVKHAEEMYWMRLELDTIRKSKEAVEDRMAELYRDVQEVIQQKGEPNTEQQSKLRNSGGMESNTRENGGSHSNHSSSRSEDAKTKLRKENYMESNQSVQVVALQRQVEKYEEVINIMKNQSEMFKKSSEGVVSSLKDEISDLMDEKTKTEMDLMSKMGELHQEKRELNDEVTKLRQQVGAQNEHKLLNEHIKRFKVKIRDVESENMRLQQQIQLQRINPSESEPSHSNTNHDDPFEFNMQSQQREQIELLNSTNQQLSESLKHARQKVQTNLIEWNEQKKELETQIQTLQKSGESEEKWNQLMQHEREYTTSALDRIMLLRESTDVSIQNLESLIVSCNGNQESNADSERNQPRRESNGTGDQVKAFAFLETSSLIYGQITSSLTLLEVRLRKNLEVLRSPESEGKTMSEDPDLQLVTIVNTHHKMIDEATDWIRAVHEKVDTDMEHLRQQYKSEAEYMRNELVLKEDEVKALIAKQAAMDDEIITLTQQNELSLSAITKTTEQSQDHDPTTISSMELFVSQKALETLQTQVLIVVQRVKEQNETISRLRSEIEEHRIRERTLMAELKRHVNDQLSRQIQDQHLNFDSIHPEQVFSSTSGTEVTDTTDSQNLPQYYGSIEEEYPESENEFSEDEVSYEEVEYEDEELSGGSSQYDELTVYDDISVYDEKPGLDKSKQTSMEQTIYEEHSLEATGDDSDEEYIVYGDHHTVC